MKSQVFSRVLRSLLPLSVIVIAISVAWWLIASKPTSQPVAAQEKAWLVQVMPVEPADYAPSLNIHGHIDSLWTTSLSAAIAADVVTVKHLAGDTVRRGQVLVQLDDQEAQLRLTQAKAQLAEAQAQVQAEHIRHQANQAALPREQQLLNLARSEERRLRNLVAKRVTAQTALDTARQLVQQRAIALTTREQQIAEHTTRLAAAEARVTQAVATQQQTELTLKYCQITAPFNGIISQVSVAPGQRVHSGTRVMQLYDTDAWIVRAAIPERYTAHLHQALANEDALLATGSLGDRQIQARLHSLGGEVTAGTGSLEAVFMVQDPPSELAQGQFITLSLTLPVQQNVVAVPSTALYGSHRLYHLDETQRLQPITVERLGEWHQPNQNTRVLVRSPQLQPGMQLVVTQLPQAVTGLLVRPSG